MDLAVRDSPACPPHSSGSPSRSFLSLLNSQRQGESIWGTPNAGSGLSLHLVVAFQVVAESETHLLGWPEDGHLEDRPSPLALDFSFPRADTDPCLLGNAALGPIPLDHHVAQIQQEDVILIKAVPGELHLPEPGGQGVRQGVIPPAPRWRGSTAVSTYVSIARPVICVHEAVCN